MPVAKVAFRGTSGSFGVPAGESHDKNQDGRAPDKDERKEDKRSGPSLSVLDAYALERWEVRSGCMLFVALIQVLLRRYCTIWCPLEAVRDRLSRRPESDSSLKQADS